MDYILTLKYFINLNFCLPLLCVVPPYGHSVDGDSSHGSLFFRSFFFFFFWRALAKMEVPFLTIRGW